MSEQNHTVGIAVTCVDARLHKHSIVPQLESQLGVDHVYVWTTAGPEGRILASDPNPHLDSLIHDLELLIKAKNAEVVAVVGHCDCAGHAVSDEQHAEDVVKAVNILNDRLETNVKVMPLLAHPPQETEVSLWEIRRVA